MNNVGAPVIKTIIEGRPYKNIKDFMKRCPLNKSAMISLIKAGAFDKLVEDFDIKTKDPRLVAMTYFLSQSYNKKTRITLQNLSELVRLDLIPKDFSFEKSIIAFDKYLKTRKSGNYYEFDVNCEEFFHKNFDEDILEFVNGKVCILQDNWKKIYNQKIEPIKKWIKENQEKILRALNILLFKEIWEKYAKGNISSWELESICFYYHEHELKNVNKNKYGIVDFNTLSRVPAVDKTFKIKGKEIPLFKIYKIAGAVISKDDNKHSIALLTTEGVVNVKFTKDYYALFGRQISEVQQDGTKKVMEKGWFNRGNKLLITGFRRDDTFVCKKYKSSGGHRLYKISQIEKNGDLVLNHERYGGE